MMEAKPLLRGWSASQRGEFCSGREMQRRKTKRIRVGLGLHSLSSPFLGSKTTPCSRREEPTADFGATSKPQRKKTLE
ncbi:hypothetical protein ACLOJK_041464 [Asimina triloba]